MNYMNFDEKFSYISKIELIIFTSIGFVITLLYRYINVKELSFLQNTLEIMKLLVLIIIYMFLNHIKSIRGEKIYKIISLFVFIRIFVIVIGLSYYNEYEMIKKIKSCFSSYDMYVLNFIYVSILYYFISFGKDEIKIYSKFIKLVVFFYFTLLLAIKVNELFYFINFIQIIYLFIKSLENIKKNSVIEEGKFDLLKINIEIFLIGGIVQLLKFFIPINNIEEHILFLSSIMYIAYIVYMIKRIFKENYNFIFSEVIETNIKLEDLNNEINESNIRLQKAYEKINTRKNLYKDYLVSYDHPIILLNENFRIQYCNNRFLNLIKENDIKSIINRRVESYINFDFNIYENIANLNRFITVIKLFNIKYEVEFINLLDEDIGIILSFKDLTEDIRLIKMKEEFESIKEREMIKKNFLSNISHDIKIPINVIYSEIQLEKILIENKDTKKLEEYNEMSKKNCLNLNKLTNNIIDLSKIDSENLEPNLDSYNIVEFIEEYIDNLSNFMESNGVEIIFDTEEEYLEIKFDKEMLRRILINLISNSIKYTGDNGLITINILNKEEYIIIEFEDNGIGMSEEFIQTVFDKYSMERREEGDFKGFGIGLYVVFNLVKAQNGDIKVTSCVGKGSKFEIKFYK